MRIGIFHGYNLTGSGSNEFTRYLARTFVDQGNSVHIICREYNPDKIDFIGQLWQWSRNGDCKKTIINHQFCETITIHQIPYGDIYPVYISGKKSSQIFKAFVDLTDRELEDFRKLNHELLMRIFSEIEIDILHANHLVMQPSLAIEPCKAHNIPFIIYPHGSAIEYTVKKDARYKEEAMRAIKASRGLIIGNHEVRDRICRLFPELENTIMAKTEIVGVGVDTQLFAPVSRADRQSSVKRLTNMDSVKSSQGKSPYLLEALHISLAERNYQVISSYDDSYNHQHVDTALKEKLSALDLSRPVLLYVGALTVGKGLQSLICALPVIYKRFPEAQLLIVGAGSFREVLESLVYALVNNDQSLLSCLIENCFDENRKDETQYWEDVSCFLNKLSKNNDYYALAKRLQKQVMFLGRFNHDQLSCLFPCADLAVFPSVIPEAYPLVLMESLANGVLPMVSYFSGFKDAVDELEQYLGKELTEYMKIPLDPQERVESLAANVVALLDATGSNGPGDQLSKIARENYDWKHRAQQMLAAYQRMLARDN